MLSSAPPRFAASSLDRLAGQWTMHTYIGDRLFDDQLQLSPDAQGRLQGSVSVPGGFTAPVEGLNGADETHFSFEIQPTENGGKFRVAYRAELDPQADTFVGFATLPDNGNQLIGGFVGQRSK